MSEEKELETPVTEEEQQEESQEEQPEPENAAFQEVVEVPWEQAEAVTRLRASASELEDFISRTLVQMEKRKISLMTQLSETERALYREASQLRESLPLNPDWTFELKLPESVGEKAYFIRKEEE